ncbi:MAG TPA: hypothetical protein VG890_07185 [Puia sp.]|nr:hypothetical protein [Puia sp.]
MRRKIFFTAGLLAIVMLIWAARLYLKPHRSTVDDAADYTIAAVALYQEFESNEQAAGKKFTGKVLEVQGLVTSIVSDARNINILLNATGTGGINCSFSAMDSAGLGKIKKGDSVSIKGRCTGFLMDVNLVDCVIGGSN